MKTYCAGCGEEFNPTEQGEEFCSWACLDNEEDED